MATTVRVPTTPNGINGFIKKLHDLVLVSDREIVLDGDHTVLAKILWNDDLSVAGRIQTRRTIIVPKTRRGAENFKAKVDEALKDGVRIVFRGDHTQVVRIQQHKVAQLHIANELFEIIQTGTMPWDSGWKVGRPRSANGNRRYGAFNSFRLNQIAAERGYSDPRWATRKYASSQKHPVRPDQLGLGTPVVRAWPDPVVVYNVEQCEGWAEPKKMELREAQNIVDRYKGRESRLGLTIEIVASNAPPCYHLHNDVIELRPKGWYDSPSLYYGDSFHEMGHSTLHHKRLHRPRMNQCICPTRVYEEYEEELIAELTASMLMAEVGDIDFTGKLKTNCAAYLDSWLRDTPNRRRTLIFAAQQATKAVDYILDIDGSRKKFRDDAVKRIRKFGCPT